MKPQNFLMAAILMLMVISIDANATEAETRAQLKAKAQISEDIYSAVRNVPFDDFVGDVACCSLDLRFSVNESSELVNFTVSGENEELVQWVSNKLEYSDLKANSILKGMRCHIKLSFKNGRYII